MLLYLVDQQRVSCFTVEKKSDEQSYELSAIEFALGATKELMGPL